MCLTDKLCVVCFLVSCLLSFSHSSTADIQTEDKTYVHDHHGYQILEKSSDVVAGIESRYFVSKIFEKYGGTNGTLKYDKFKSLMLSLGLGKNTTTNSTLNKNSSKQNNRHGDKTDKHDHTGSDVNDGKHEHNHTDVHNEHNSDLLDELSDQEINSTELHSEDDHSHELHNHGSYDHDSDSNHDDHDVVSSHDDHDHVNALEKDASAVKEVSEDEAEEEVEKNGANKKKRKKKKKKKKSGRKKELKGRTKRNLEHPTSHSHCLSPSELLKTFHLDGKTAINKTEFMFLCPALLFQLDQKSCIKSDGEHFHGNHGDHDHVDHDHVDKENHDDHDHNMITTESINNILPKVWGYSTIAVIVISLAGLLGVAVIPIMQKVFYNHLLQFLVALAVGALAGDALLHLLPHAMGGGHSTSAGHDHSNGDHSHLKSTYKGLLALTGIFFFFLMERILTIITDLRRKKKQTKRLKSSVPLKPCTIDTHKAVGAKLSTHVDSDYQTCEEMVMIVHPNKALRNLADDTHDSLLHDHSNHRHHHHGTTRQHSEDEESLHSLSHSHHGHSHHVPADVKSQSVAAIAWMVILGDGIHNFSDGLAIGAAFANSITGGISTSVAVLCHELPHEIGDFAVLLRAGMNIKQAIMYNCVSSLLCFFGMLIGVALGNLSEASLWIFSCVGGMFLYIALVDMLPEMTSVDTKHGENPFCHLLFQCAGMLLGSGIMFIIALYEPELLSALDKHT